MTTLHGGTVTFVFTDIEGSTKLLERLGDRYAEALAEHRRIIREAFGARGGREIDTQGDAFFYAFERARDAVAAAVGGAARARDARLARRGGALRVRMSVHTGEPVVGEEGYVGIDVHRAARICSAGHGGQVLLSATTAALVSGALPDGVTQADLGDVRLKDIERAGAPRPARDRRPARVVPAASRGEEEPMDFGDRLAQKIKADVERRIEASLSGATPEAVKGTSRPALVGLIPSSFLSRRSSHRAARQAHRLNLLAKWESAGADSHRLIPAFGGADPLKAPASRSQRPVVDEATRYVRQVSGLLAKSGIRRRRISRLARSPPTAGQTPEGARFARLANLAGRHEATRYVRQVSGLLAKSESARSGFPPLDPRLRRGRP